MSTFKKFGSFIAAVFVVCTATLPGYAFATGTGQPTISITAPTGGENLIVGQTYHITWTSSSNVDKVSLGYSFGEGSLNWFANNAANNISNTNSYDWTVDIGSHTMPAQVRMYAIGYNTGTGSAYTYSNYFTVSSPATVPVLASYAPTDITQTSATLHGAVNYDGGSPVTSENFVYAGYSSGTIAPTSPLSSTPSANLTGLSCGQTYTYHLQATNAVGTSNSFTDQILTTLACGTTTTTTQTLASVTTLPATVVTPTSVFLNGSLTSTGGLTVSSIGFNYGLTTSYGSTLDGGAAPFETPFGNYVGLTSNSLQCNTQYHFRAYATNALGTAYGTDMTFTTAACGTTVSTGAVDKTVTITSGGKTRSYLIHIPAGTDTTTKRPLLIAFHGAGDTARGFADWTKFSTVADSYNYITVYPESYVSSWADGRGMAPEDALGINDMQFARDVVADVVSKYAVDTAHVYATGFSSGGYFTHKLACQANDVFRGFAPVGAGFPDTLTSNCAPQNARSLIFIQGSEDADSGTTTSGVRIYSGNTTLVKWGTFNFCTDSVALSGGTIQEAAHTVCKNGTRIAQKVVGGAGHTWVRQTGFDTSAVIMDFFQQDRNGSWTGSYATSNSTTTSTTTTDSLLRVRTNEVVQVGRTGAVLSGSITTIGSVRPVMEGISISKTAYGPGVPVVSAPYTTYGVGTFNLGTNVLLECGTLYHYNAFATPAVGVANVNGEDKTFMTKPCSESAPLTVVTGPVNSMYDTYGYVTGTVIDSGTPTATLTAGVDYGLTSSYGYTGAGTSIITSNAPFAAGTLPNLLCSTTYHYRVSANNGSTTAYGNDATFTTQPCTGQTQTTTYTNTTTSTLGCGMGAMYNSMTGARCNGVSGTATTTNGTGTSNIGASSGATTGGTGTRANLARLVILKSLRYGQNDPEVKNLQNYLLARGYLSGTATGFYGAMTRAGVKKLQSDLGIVSDGNNVGPATRTALSNLK